MQLARPEVTESVFQYISVWKVLAGDRPDADLGDRQGLSMCWADSLVSPPYVTRCNRLIAQPA